MEALFVVLLVAAGFAGVDAARGRPSAAKAPFATIALAVLVLACSIPQLTFAPSLYDALRRDRQAIAGGEVWRLLTAAVVQDSGWPGLVFNVVALAVLGTLAERRWGTARWLVLALVVQVLGCLWGLLTQPIGAGTSLIDFGLAAAVSMAALRQGPGLRARIPAATALALSLTLLVLGDIHGGAAAIGAVVAAIFVRLGPVPSPGPDPAANREAR